jgi:hypothetical protein
VYNNVVEKDGTAAGWWMVNAVKEVMPMYSMYNRYLTAARTWVQAFKVRRRGLGTLGMDGSTAQAGAVLAVWHVWQHMCTWPTLDYTTTGPCLQFMARKRWHRLT